MEKIAEERVIFLLYENNKQYHVDINLHTIKKCFPTVPFYLTQTVDHFTTAEILCTV